MWAGAVFSGNWSRQAIRGLDPAWSFVVVAAYTVDPVLLRLSKTSCHVDLRHKSTFKLSALGHPRGPAGQEGCPQDTGSARTLTGLWAVSA